VTDAKWPALPYEAWKDTYATLHMWTQVVGKVALALSPPLNHSWGIALQVTPRGLATRTLAHGDRSFTMEFDFAEDRMVVRVSDGSVGMVALVPQTVADFYAKTMRLLADMELPVTIWPAAVEVPEPVRLDEDTVHASYDREYVGRLHWILVRLERILQESRCDFVGKCSPAHFFWGAFDLALTRFSGRPAPPREGPAFMREAYSHEVISHGFWPGSGNVLEPSLYAYAVPEPAGFKEARVEPAAARYDSGLGEFLLPYEAVRTADDPERAVRGFVRSTYERAATLGGWDRASLERAS